VLPMDHQHLTADMNHFPQLRPDVILWSSVIR
jgi:hypothetical protein